MNNVVSNSQGGASEGEELHTEFCSGFCLIFFRAFASGGMFGAHGKIAYLSLPFGALMRALSARAAAAR